MKKCIVGKASTFRFDFKLSKSHLWGREDSPSRNWSFFLRANYPLLFSLWSIYLSLITCCYLVSLVDGNMSFFSIAFKLRNSKVHMDFRSQGDVCHLLPSFGLVAAEGEAQHVFCLPIIMEATGESLERNKVIILWAYVVHTDSLHF